MKRRIIRRELLAHRRFFLLLAANIALGLFGFALLDCFKASLQQHLSDRSRELMGADLTISARRSLTPEEEAALKRAIDSNSSQVKLRLSLYSMLRGSSGSRLAHVVAYEPGLPFYGSMELESQGKVVGSDTNQIHQEKVAWIYPELARQLGVKVGDTVKIGQTQVRIGDLVVDDGGVSWESTSLAPRIYVGHQVLQESGLIQKGSLLFHSYMVATGSDRSLDALATTLDQTLTDQSLRIRRHDLSEDRTGRMLGYLADYLGLVALAAMFLAAVGINYLIRAYLRRRWKDCAVFVSQGFQSIDVIAMLTGQIVIVGLLAALVVLAGVMLAKPLFPMLLGSLLPEGLTLTVGIRTLAVTLLLGTLGPIVIGLPVLLRLTDLRPGELFQESANRGALRFGARVWRYLPALFCFWALAVIESNSLRVGSLFVGIFFSAALLSLLFAAGFRMFAKLLSSASSMPLRIGARALYRNRSESLTAMMTLSLAVFLASLIPQLSGGLLDELAAPSGDQIRPTFFMFDIQEEQAESLEAYLQDRDVTVQKFAPMVTARLLTINGKEQIRPDANDQAVTREDERERWTRNRSYNLSYRERLGPDETIVAGRHPSEQWVEGETPEMTLDERFAERLGVGIGDIMLFDVQGVPVEGKVVGLRKVNWATFQPNFFVLFQPGVLELAPKTYLASIATTSKDAVQDGVVERFPNVSMIDVSRLVDRVATIVERMTAILKMMAYLSVIVGFAVLFALARHQATERQWDYSLMKVLGAREQLLMGAVVSEFLLIGLSAVAFSALGSYGAVYLVSMLVFGSVWSFSWGVFLLQAAMTLFLVFMVVGLATRKVVLVKPSAILEGSPMAA